MTFLLFCFQRILLCPSFPKMDIWRACLLGSSRYPWRSKSKFRWAPSEVRVSGADLHLHVLTKSRIRSSITGISIRSPFLLLLLQPFIAWHPMYVRILFFSLGSGDRWYAARAISQGAIFRISCITIPEILRQIWLKASLIAYSSLSSGLPSG